MGECVMRTFSVRIDDELFKQVEDYRIKRRKANGSLPSRNEVIAELLRRGLRAGSDDDRSVS